MYFSLIFLPNLSTKFSHFHVDWNDSLGILFLFMILKKNVSMFSNIGSFHKEVSVLYGFYYVRVPSSFLVLWVFSSWKDVGICQIFFRVSWDNRMDSFFYHLLMWCTWFCIRITLWFDNKSFVKHLSSISPCSFSNILLRISSL